MKKFFFGFILFSAITLSSCGGSKVCDCVKTFNEMSKELSEAAADSEKQTQIIDKYKSQMEECNKLTENKTDEEVQKIQEEMEACGEK